MFRAVLASVAALFLLPAVAHAYEVRISLAGAGQVTETTTANLVGSSCVTSSTNPSGTVGKTCLAGTPSGDYGWNWDVDYVATPKPGYRFVRWESDGTARSGVICDRSSPAATTTTYTGTVCKFRTPSDLQTRAVFVDDTAPAMSSLSGPNQVVGGAATFTFSAAADPTFRYFECRVAGVHDWQQCSSGWSEDPATSGTYTFEVRAVDWSSNRSSTSSRSWTVDKLPPETSLNGPTGTVPSTSATFSFSSNEQGTFRCSLDGAGATSCPSPVTYSNLGQGEHTLTVFAVDAVGNADLSPASRTWTVDTVPAETVLDPSGPSGTTGSTTATFTFSSEPGAKFNCRLDNLAINTDCTSPVTYTGIATGQHTFRVWARDATGNTDPTPSMRVWTVTAPGIGAAPAAHAFGTQAVGTIGAARTVTLTSNGDVPLTIGRLRLAGALPEDFVPVADDCTGETIDPGNSCTVKVRFAPSATGARIATLRVFSDAAQGTVDVALSGTGTAPAAGTPGPAGPRGPVGPVGPVGPPGRDARVTCSAGKAKKGKVKVTCKVTYVAAKSARTVRGRLSRNGRTYARLSRRSIAGGRVGLRLRATRRLPAGRYWLVVVTTDRRDHETVARHRVRVR